MENKNIALKKIIGTEHRIHLIVFMIALFIVSYYSAAHFHMGYPKYFALSEFERDIPLMPWTVWIYIGLYPFLVWQAFSYHNIENLNRLAYAFSTILIFSTFIFFIYPVTYPREFYPLAPDNDLTHLAFRILRNLDKPVNCFPSLHVGSTFLMAFGLWGENRKKFWFSLTYAVLVAISTLTTKQHYFADVFFGLTVAGLLYFVFWRLIDIKKY